VLASSFDCHIIEHAPGQIVKFLVGTANVGNMASVCTHGVRELERHSGSEPETAA
jgi:hypothetical protein